MVADCCRFFWFSAKNEQQVPGIRLSDIVRLLFGYYIYDPANNEIIAHGQMK